MKTGNTFFVQLSRNLFTDEHKRLSINAKWLYVVLVELEHRFTGKDRDHFVRSNDGLASDAGMSLPTLKKAKAELLGVDLVESWQTHYILDKKTGRLSEKHITAYRIKQK